MAWLSSGGTDFLYRMSIPVANPSTQGDRIIDNVPFPAWYLRVHPDGAKILQSGYQDVHITKADGTTELPCALNAAKTALSIDYAAMPTGRTTLYVYYGHASAPAPSPYVGGASAVVQILNANHEVSSEADSSPLVYIWGGNIESTYLSSGIAGYESGGTLIDSGFEYGSDGTNLTAGTWANSGSPVRREVDTAQYKVGTKSAYLKGAVGGWSGVSETTSAGMTANTAEYRFWTRFGSASSYYAFVAAAVEGQFIYMRHIPGGALDIYTERNVTGYTQNDYTQIASGLSAATWYQFRIVFNYTNDTWEFSYRTTPTGAWTQCKSSGASDYNIPARSTANLAQSSSFIFQQYNSAEQWIDEVQYANGGITDTAGQDDTDTYFGASTNMKSGWNTTGSTKNHALLKFFEGALPLGVISDVKLRLYLETAPTNDLTLYAHRLKTTAGVDQYAHVQTGWGLQSQTSRPTWNERMTDFQADDTETVHRAWLTPGATNTSEIDSSEYASLAVTGGQSAGYVSFDLPDQWMVDWLGDNYSQGVVIKDSLNSGARNSICTFTRETQTNSPVVEVQYSSLSGDQFSKRKYTSSTYTYSTFSTHHRYVQIPSTNGFAVMANVNNNMGMDISYITPEGRIHRVVKDTKPGGSRLNNNSPCYGLYYDAGEGRFWLAGNKTNSGNIGKFLIAYSDPYVATGWVWTEHGTELSAKSAISPRSGVATVVNYDGSPAGGSLNYFTFTRSTGLFSGIAPLVSQNWAGTARGLSAQINSGDVMTGAGVIYANGAISDYPAFGSLILSSGGIEEAFWYTGKSGNNFTGVTRAMFGTIETTFGAGTAITLNRGPLTYVAMAEDAANSCTHVTYVENSLTGYPGYSGAYNYTRVGYIRHNYADASSVWKDENSVNTLTLPIDQRNERTIPHAATDMYASDLIALSSGDVLVAGYVPTFDAWMWKLPSNSTAWSETDIVGGNQEGSFVDLVGSDVVCSGVSYTDNKIFKRQSDDNGSTWGVATDLASFTFPAGGLWCSSISYQGNLGDKGIAYAQHFAPFGAIYIQGVEMITQSGILLKMMMYMGA